MVLSTAVSQMVWVLRYSGRLPSARGEGVAPLKSNTPLVHHINDANRSDPGRTMVFPDLICLYRLEFRSRSRFDTEPIIIY